MANFARGFDGAEYKRSPDSPVWISVETPLAGGDRLTLKGGGGKEPDFGVLLDEEDARWLHAQLTKRLEPAVSKKEDQEESRLITFKNGDQRIVKVGDWLRATKFMDAGGRFLQQNQIYKVRSFDAKGYPIFVTDYPNEKDGWHTYYLRPAFPEGASIRFHPGDQIVAKVNVSVPTGYGCAKITQGNTYTVVNVGEYGEVFIDNAEDAYGDIGPWPNLYFYKKEQN